MSDCFYACLFFGGFLMMSALCAFLLWQIKRYRLRQQSLLLLIQQRNESMAMMETVITAHYQQNNMLHRLLYEANELTAGHQRQCQVLLQRQIVWCKYYQVPDIDMALECLYNLSQN